MTDRGMTTLQNQGSDVSTGMVRLWRRLCCFMRPCLSEWPCTFAWKRYCCSVEPYRWGTYGRFLNRGRRSTECFLYASFRSRWCWCGLYRRCWQGFFPMFISMQLMIDWHAFVLTLRAVMLRENNGRSSSLQTATVDCALRRPRVRPCSNRKSFDLCLRFSCLGWWLSRLVFEFFMLTGGGGSFYKWVVLPVLAQLLWRLRHFHMVVKRTMCPLASKALQGAVAMKVVEFVIVLFLEPAKSGLGASENCRKCRMR